jgi:preprotein translocase subunit SecA
MLGFITSFFDSNDKEIRKARKILQQINALEEGMQKRSWKQLRARIKEIQKDLKTIATDIPEFSRDSLIRIDRSKGLPDFEVRVHTKLMGYMPEVFAMVREVMRREFDRRHYDVQIIAGIILAQGQKLTELKTGEGKTQVFHLPLILYS